MPQPRIAILGATGNVGREMLRVLAERAFPHSAVRAVASARSTGKRLSFGEDKELTVEDADGFDWSQVDLVFSSPGAKAASVHCPLAARHATVIDNSSHFRMHGEVPLVVPEVNPEALDGFSGRGIIANPNCSTIQLVVALKPVHDLFSVRRVVVATYQATSGSGKAGMDELYSQSRAILQAQAPQCVFYPKQIAFNAIPHIDRFVDDGETREEWKMCVETQKILDPAIELAATCVRIPTFIGHAEAVHVTCERPVSLHAARRAIREGPGLALITEESDSLYVTPRDCQGEDSVYVSRLRGWKADPCALQFWCVADNLRKGAALNAVQIAETLLARNRLMHAA